MFTCLLTACTPDRPPTDQPTPRPSAALEISLVSGADDLDEQARTELESQVGDVLSAYIVAGWLGDYPRDNFVPAFDRFTSLAAQRGVEDLELLTAERFKDARSVTATRLKVRVFSLVDGKDVIGATARVAFEFEADTGAQSPTPITLRGRFMLVEEKGTWSVFGYDVKRHDSGVPS